MRRHFESKAFPQSLKRQTNEFNDSQRSFSSSTATLTSLTNLSHINRREQEKAKKIKRFALIYTTPTRFQIKKKLLLS
jgi:hypothetical protein